MSTGQEKRSEDRLDYQWPIWFGKDFSQAVCEGLMVDVSSGGVAFTCKSGPNCPQPDEELAVRFSIPRFDDPDPTATVSISRTGVVRRVDQIDGAVRRVAFQFDKPLTLKPCEEAKLQAIHSRGSEG